MRATHHDVFAILRREGVICRHEHPDLATAIDWLVRTGRLRSVLRGSTPPRRTPRPPTAGSWP